MNQNFSDSIYVQVKNGGGFMAEFYIDYELDGQTHHLDSGAFSLGFSRRLNIPSKATNIFLKIQIWIFGSSLIVFHDYLPNIEPTCFLLYGTIFNPTCARVPCNFVGDEEPNPCCCCCCHCHNKY